MRHEERTLSTSAAGFLEIDTDAVSVEVIVERRSNIHVTLSTESGDDEKVQEAMQKAVLGTSGGRARLRLFAPTYQFGRGNSIRGGGIIQGDVIVGGVVQYNSFGGGRQTVRTTVGGLHATVRVPQRTSLDFNGQSADLDCDGTLDAVEASAASGGIRLFEVNSLNANAASGDVHVDRVHGGATVNTASGDIEVGRVAGQLTAKSASGDIEVGEMDGGTLNTMSGDIEVGRAAGWVSARSMSGNVRGPAGDNFRASTMSGRVRQR